MSKNKILTLDDNDPSVIAARDSEKSLFDFYGLDMKTYFLTLPGLGIRIRITEIGSGEPVVIVPGNTGDSFPFAPLIAQLKGQRIIAINRPGGGLSEGIDHRTVDFRRFAVDTLSFVLDSLNLQNVAIVAHSMGGFWSLWLAMDKPERVRNLTIIGACAGTSMSFTFRLLATPGINNIIFNLLMPKSIKQSLSKLSFLGHTPASLSQLPKAMAECYYYFQKLPHYKISTLSLMERVKRPDAIIQVEQTKLIQQPIMFLWGMNDTSGDIEVVRKNSKIPPFSEFHEIQGGGHLPWLDNPDSCGDLIQEFLSNN